MNAEAIKTLEANKYTLCKVVGDNGQKYLGIVLDQTPNGFGGKPMDRMVWSYDSEQDVPSRLGDVKEDIKHYWGEEVLEKVNFKSMEPNEVKSYTFWFFNFYVLAAVLELIRRGKMEVVEVDYKWGRLHLKLKRI